MTAAHTEQSRFISVYARGGSIAQLFSATLNGGLAAPLSRLSGHWSKPSEAGRFLFLKRSDLGHLNENGCSGDFTNAGDRA